MNIVTIQTKLNIGIVDSGFILYNSEILKIYKIRKIKILVENKNISISYELATEDSISHYKIISEDKVFKTKEEVISYFNCMLDKICPPLPNNQTN